MQGFANLKSTNLSLIIICILILLFMQYDIINDNLMIINNENKRICISQEENLIIFSKYILS